eukprot:scaffold8117_cov56-Prasinocladus_malaysianus.AAC.1
MPPRSYALRSLYACDPEEVAFYLPQLVQALRSDKTAARVSEALTSVIAGPLLDRMATSRSISRLRPPGHTSSATA